jgi:hypothetical protein
MIRGRGKDCNHQAVSYALYWKRRQKIGGAVMMEEVRGWIHRHINVVLSFGIGLSVGISILALAYFSTRNEVAAEALRYGVQITRHPDVGEDMVWFFCGIVVGAAVISLAWWRDGKAKSVGLEKADVLNRLFTDPTPPIVRRPERSRQNADV